MKKQSFLFALLIAAAVTVFAAETGDNNSVAATKQTKQLLKFSAQEFTGTEDSAAEPLEAIPTATQATQEKVNADTIAQPANKNTGEKQSVK